jgi:serine/threonine protein kinase
MNGKIENLKRQIISRYKHDRYLELIKERDQHQGNKRSLRAVIAEICALNIDPVIDPTTIITRENLKIQLTDLQNEIASRVNLLLENEELSLLCETERRNLSTFWDVFNVYWDSQDQIKSSSNASQFCYGGKPIEELEIIRTNRVLRGYSTILQKKVIVKIENEFGDLEREVSKLHILGKSPRYVVQLYEHIRLNLHSSGFDYLVLNDFGVPLTSFLTSDEEGECDSSFSLRLVKEILHAVNWIHSKCIVHCDLKPENILVHDKGRGVPEVRLCDFDSACVIGETWKIYPWRRCSSDGSPVDETGVEDNGPESGAGHLKFSRCWMSPEVYYFNLELSLRTSSPVGPSLSSLNACKEMDYFSLGLVLGCLLARQKSPGMSLLPLSDDDLRVSFANRNYLDAINCDLIPSCRPHVLRLCSYEPKERGESLDEMIESIEAFGRTRLHDELTREREWWDQNSGKMRARIEELTKEIMESQRTHGDFSASSFATTEEMNLSLNELAMSLSIDMSSQSRVILDRIESVRRFLEGSEGKERELLELLKKVSKHFCDLR